MRQEEKRNRHGYRDECDGLADTWSGFTRPDSVLVRPRISHATEMLSERIGIVSELGELADRNQLALLLMAHGVRVSGLFVCYTNNALSLSIKAKTACRWVGELSHR